MARHPVLTHDRDFYKKAVAITIPIALQNLIATSLNMVDTVLISGLGKTAVAAVGLANQVFFLFNLVSFGICSGAAIFISQYWGERDTGNIRRVLGLTLAANIAVALVFCAAGFLFPGPILRLFTRDPEVILLGVRFLRLVSFSYILFAVTFPYAFTLRGIGQTTYPMLTGFVAFFLNTLLNFGLIYGRMGLPRLGITGSALATLLARAAETIVLLSLVYALQLVPAARLRELADLSASFARRVYRTILPVIANETLWALGVTMFTVVYARMGTEVVAAYNIFSTIDRLAMVLFFGLANACAVLVGEKIGAGRDETAFTYARTLALLGPGIGILVAVILALLAGQTLSIFRLPTHVTLLAGQFAAVYALAIPVKVFNLINVVGILRSGGDTKYSLFLDTVGLWFLAVPLAFFAGLVWRLSPIGVYALALLEEIFKFTLGLRRLLSRRWINRLTVCMDEFAPQPRTRAIARSGRATLSRD